MTSTSKGAAVKKKRKTAPVAKDEGKKVFAPGGTPVGWSFWGTWDLCKRMGYLKYIEGLSPIVTPEELNLGSAYHGLMEGHGIDVISAHSPEMKAQAADALRLYLARKGEGAPPMPKDIVSSEQMKLVPGIPMTSKPDRVEKVATGPQVREFKTAKRFYDSDDQKWDVSGEVIGEMLASGTGTAIVDIIEKSKGKVRQLEVKLTPEKTSALMGLVESLRDDVVMRVKKWRALGNMPEPLILDRVFPKSLNQCGYQFGKPCPFYERCWSKSGSQHLYVKKDATEVAVWRSYLGV